MFNASSLANSRGSLCFDFDVDGNVDAFYSGTQFVYLRNTGGGVFLNMSVPVFAANFLNFDTADFNNDGLPDLLAGGQFIAYSTGNNDVVFTATGASTTTLTGVVALHIDNDGWPDFAYNAQTGVLFYVNQKNKSFALSYNYTMIPTLGNDYMAAADFNKDGYTDVIVDVFDYGAGNSNLLCIFINQNGNGLFVPNNVSFSSANYANGQFSLMDFNNDGLMDVGVAGASASAAIYVNNGNLVFATYYTTFSANRIIAADFTNDGLVDVAVSSTFYQGFANGTYISTLGGPYTAPSWPSLIDANNDGAMDVFTSAGTNALVLINQNTGLSYTPLVPVSLTAIWLSSTLVNLTWSLNANNYDTYNVYVSTSPASISSTSYVLAPLAVKATGRRFLAAHGNAFKNSFLLVTVSNSSIPYYWSVQAIGPNFVPSAFATEQVTCAVASACPKASTTNSSNALSNASSLSSFFS